MTRTINDLIGQRRHWQHKGEHGKYRQPHIVTAKEAIQWVSNTLLPVVLSTALRVKPPAKLLKKYPRKPQYP